MTTGRNAGEGNNGTFNGYLNSRSNGTGEAGRKTSIGRSNKHGASKARNSKNNRNNLLKRCNHDGLNHSTKRPDRNTRRNKRSKEKVITRERGKIKTLAIHFMKGPIPRKGVLKRVPLAGD
ncbi:MAG: hypothetical protein ACD_75C00196G0008 [uncultured bacterium]|nr:MAG: hypothetical protein ACD_75C00196G0008 [uncultured bacterium]